jgi:hypothetical protein
MSRSVLVRGFDYGTVDEQIASHMSGAGTIESVQPVDQGIVSITYTSAEEAKAAVQLDQTCIAGNSRYIDVITLDPMEFLAQSNVDPQKGQQFLAMNTEQQHKVMARGSLSTARDPTAVLVQRMKQAREGGAGGGNAFQSIGGDFSGECSVLVRGFDFNTSDEQIGGHMSGVGTIQNLQWIDNGSVRITYASAEEAQTAVQLNQTIIAGNSRYIDVVFLDPGEFLSQFNIDMDKVMQFSALTPEQQLAVMAKGSLASARDPNAVLISRMNQVKNGVQGKGSFGPAQGKGNSSNGPYGGGMGNGGEMETMMMKQMEMMMMNMMQMMAGSPGAQQS